MRRLLFVWSHKLSGRAVAVAAAAVLGATATVAITGTAFADVCNPVVNAIACENSKTGNPSSEWDVEGAGDATIQGFATDISVNAGSSINFKIKTSFSSYTI